MSELKKRLGQVKIDWCELPRSLRAAQKHSIAEFVREVNRRSEASRQTSVPPLRPTENAIQDTLKELGIEL